MSMSRIGPREVAHKDHAVIEPVKTLRDKALSKVKQTPQEFAEAMDRAERALDTLAASYDEWMLSATDTLCASFAAFAAGPCDAAAAKALFLVAQDFRGQARQLGHGVAAQATEGLCALLQTGDGHGLPVHLVQAYVESIASIVRSGLRNEATAVSTELANGLAVLVADHRAKIARKS